MRYLLPGTDAAMAIALRARYNRGEGDHERRDGSDRATRKPPSWGELYPRCMYPLGPYGGGDAAWCGCEGCQRLATVTT